MSGFINSPSLRYSHHRDPSIRLLHSIEKTLPLRSLERDILVCAILYLEGDLQPGHSVAAWWTRQDDIAALDQK